MSKTPLPFYVADISGLARTMRRQIDDLDRTPSHVEMLNLLAKAGGFRNFQHFRATVEPEQTAVKTTQSIETEVNLKRIKQLIRHYDNDGRLIRWPKKFTVRMLTLWVMWSRLPARQSMSEPEINEFIEARHLFTDHALLRRELVDRGFISRTADGRQYTRLERQPTPEAIEAFRQLRTAHA